MDWASFVRALLHLSHSRVLAWVAAVLGGIALAVLVGFLLCVVWRVVVFVFKPPPRE